jgi:hypothetical protein
MKRRVLALAIGLALSAGVTFRVGNVDYHLVELSGWLRPGARLQATQAINSRKSLAPAMIKIGGGTIHVGFAPGHLSLAPTVLLEWVSAAARAVTTY